MVLARTARLCVFVFAALVVPACRCGSSLGLVNAKNAGASGAPRTEPRHTPEYAVVWGGQEGSYESLWFEWRAPNLRILGKRSGAVFLAGDGVYLWRDTTAVLKGVSDCDYAWKPDERPAPDNHQDLTVNGAVALRLDAPGKTVIAEFPDVSDANSYSNSVTLEASAGPYLFVQSQHNGYFCGDLRQTIRQSDYLFDLVSEKIKEFPSKDETAALRKRVLEVAGDEIGRCVVEVRQQMEPPGPESLDEYELAAVVPRFTLERGLRFRLGFSFYRSLVDGDRRCEAEVDQAPPTLAAHPSPAGLKELLRQNPKFEVRGWSVLGSTDVERVAAITRAFAVEEPELEAEPSNSAR